MRSLLAGSLLMLVLTTTTSAKLEDYHDVNIHIINQTSVGAWIMVYVAAGGNVGAFCVSPGHRDEKYFPTASNVVAEIKGGHDCSGAPRKRLSADLTRQYLRKTITGSGDSITW